MHYSGAFPYFVRHIVISRWRMPMLSALLATLLCCPPLIAAPDTAQQVSKTPPQHRHGSWTRSPHQNRKKISRHSVLSLTVTSRRLMSRRPLAAPTTCSFQNSFSALEPPTQPSADTRTPNRSTRMPCISAVSTMVSTVSRKHLCYEALSAPLKPET